MSFHMLHDHEAVADGVCLQKFANMMRVVILGSAMHVG